MIANGCADPQRLGYSTELLLVREARVGESAWEWGTPPDFGGVCSGECEFFLCENAQGGRGKSALEQTFGPQGDDAADNGVWMSIWVDDVDAVHDRCLEQGLEVTWPPTDMPWNVREMHVRHPDGHVFRISRGLEETDSR